MIKWLGITSLAVSSMMAGASSIMLLKHHDPACITVALVCSLITAALAAGAFYWMKNG